MFRSDNSHLFSLTEKTIARKRPSALEHGMYYCQPVLPQQEEILEKMADAAYAKQLADNAYTIREKLTSAAVFEDWYRYLYEELPKSKN